MGRFGYLVGAWIALGLLLGARPAGAQIVRGWVEQADGVPIFGAFIMLEDSSGVVSSRVLSTESGSYRITAPAPGAY